MEKEINKRKKMPSPKTEQMRPGVGYTLKKTNNGHESSVKLLAKESCGDGMWIAVFRVPKHWK
jgi:hypothetical protein